MNLLTQEECIYINCWTFVIAWYPCFTWSNITKLRYSYFHTNSYFSFLHCVEEWVLLVQWPSVRDHQLVFGIQLFSLIINYYTNAKCKSNNIVFHLLFRMPNNTFYIYVSWILQVTFRTRLLGSTLTLDANTCLFLIVILIISHGNKLRIVLLIPPMLKLCSVISSCFSNI